jgi:hypothetical protein
VRVLDFGSKWADTELSDTGTPHRYGSDAFEEQEYDDGFDDATTYENTLRAASSLLVPFLRPLNEVPLVVRRRQGVKGIGSVQLHASIYVDYLQMPQTDESARHVELYYSRQTYAIRRMIPPCKEYVLHLSYDPFLPRIWLADHHIALPHTIERVTLVMAPIVHTGPTGMQPDRPLGLLRALLWGFIHYIPNMPLTVVGVENMHPSTLGFPASTEALITPDEAIAMAQQMAAGLVGTFSVDPEPHISGPRGLTNVGWDHHHDVDQQLEALSRLTFLTFEAWEQSLPADSPLVNPPLYEPL